MTKEFVQVPKCPFCGTPINRPEISSENPDIFLGRCSCGAVYACDESGKNIGNALIEALVFACNKDWNKAWELSEGEDFFSEIIDNYDPISHLIVPSRSYDQRRIHGALCFVRLNTLELKKEEKMDEESVFEKLSKEDVERLISEYKIEDLVGIAGKDKKLIRNIQRLLYSADPLIRERAAEALGKVCAVMSKRNYNQVTRLFQNLLYSLVDSASYSVGAFSAVAEIIAHCDLYDSYIPYLYQLASEKTRRAKTIMALAKISESKPDLLREKASYFRKFLEDKDPEVRGWTVILLGRIRATELKDEIAKLKGDMNRISVYDKGNIVSKTINEIVEDTLSKL